MKNILTLVFLLTSFYTFSQQQSLNEKKIHDKIHAFFVKNGEITEKNKLDVAAYEIADSTKTLNEEIGIFLIRTVYRTDGEDFLLFKDKSNIKIISFKSLNKIIQSTLNLFRDDEVKLKEYLPLVLKWYDETQNTKRKIRFTEYKKE